MNSILCNSGDKVWVGSTCKEKTKKKQEKFASLSSKYGKYCCPVSGGLEDCDVDKDCPAGEGTFNDAVKDCDKNGRRLCTRDELQKRTCCGENCESRGFWTSTVGKGNTI